MLNSNYWKCFESFFTISRCFNKRDRKFGNDLALIVKTTVDQTVIFLIKKDILMVFGY